MTTGANTITRTGVTQDGSTGVEDLPEGQAELERNMDARYGPRNHHIGLRPRKRRTYDVPIGADVTERDIGLEHVHASCHEPMGLLFLTEQMSLKRGLKKFGRKGADAVVDEMRQIDRMNVIIPRAVTDLSRIQKQRALRYLMYLKEKRCGKIKARGCADGRKQRLYKSRAEVSAPTVRTESIFLTSLIDAHEKRVVVTVDIPGAFMHSDMDELIHIRMEGKMAELLARVDPRKYRKFIAHENGRPVIYVELTKAL